jgi:putative exosortase-associated protein (TIGR04073 family)
MKGEPQFMKITVTVLSFLLFAFIFTSSYALESPKPESIAEKMSFKLLRGGANLTTSIVEIPKQIYLTGRTHGAIGYVVGPMKGVGMTLYRGFIGLSEIILFMVPQPGYYDPMIDPEFVWQGWEDLRADPSAKEATSETSEK